MGGLTGPAVAHRPPARQFLTADEAAERVTPQLARRITACLEAVEAGTVATLENGSPVT